MAKLSSLVEKLEKRAENKFGKLVSHHKDKAKRLLPLFILGWYFYGMFINSIRLGIASTFGAPEEKPVSIWVANPIKNLLAIFTPTSLVVTVVCILLICLVTKKGYGRIEIHWKNHVRSSHKQL